MAAIEFDITDTLDQFNKLASDMPFLISRSLNDVGFKRGRKDISKDMSKNMVARDRFFLSERSIKVLPSNKNNLEITLYHFKEMMELQQFGGNELPKGKKLAIPIRKNLSKYANIPNNKKIPKNMSINTLLDKAPKKSGEPVYKAKGVKPFVLKRGVFIRTEQGLRLLYSFVDKATHTKKLLQMQQVIEKTYNVNFERFFERNYLKVLKG